MLTGKSVEHELRSFGHLDRRLESEHLRYTFGADASKTIVGRLCGEESGPDLLHVQLVLAGRGARVEPAPVFVGHHVERSPTARDADEQT
jgi:hypothetical protein